MGCCKDGWPVTLAGSRFLNYSESGDFAQVEREALAFDCFLE